MDSGRSITRKQVWTKSLCIDISSFSWASLVAQRLKRLPAMQETRVQSLGREYPLEKEMAAHSSILAWRISWTEEPGGLQSVGSHGLTDRTEACYHTCTHPSLRKQVQFYIFNGTISSSVLKMCILTNHTHSMQHQGN